MEEWASLRDHLGEGIPSPLPNADPADPSVDHAPARKQILTAAEKRLALRNALRYFDPSEHAALIPEFRKELEVHGRIYMMRLRPTEYEMRAHPIEAYPAR